MLNLGARWRWMINTMSQLLYSWDRAPITHCTGGWVGLRASLDRHLEEKIFCPDWG